MLVIGKWQKVQVKLALSTPKPHLLLKTKHETIQEALHGFKFYKDDNVVAKCCSGKKEAAI